MENVSRQLVATGAGIAIDEEHHILRRDIGRPRQGIEMSDGLVTGQMSREIESCSSRLGDCDCSDRCDLVRLKSLIANDDARRVVIVAPNQLDWRMFINPPCAV
jgi:hypothetical protein